jgi:hypothetical protein
MRYYKPRLREYVSTQVDMPWEFLQGVAEQKQKGYDTALATGDAASNLLNFEVIPGDVQFKNELQRKYNDRIMEAQKYVQQTGDFSKASRDLMGIVRDISQDPYINNMKAAVPIWKEQRKSAEELDSQGEILDFNRNSWDYMYSTVDKETGATRSYNQKLPYKARTLGKAFYDDVKDAIDGRVIQKFSDRVKKVNGEWIYNTTGKRLDSELLPIMKTALQEIIPRYPNYFRDRTKYEIQQGVSKEDATPSWIDNMTKALAAEYHVNDLEVNYNWDELDLYEKKKQLDELAEQPLVLPGQAIDIPGNVFNTSVWDKQGLNLTNKFEFEPGMVYDGKTLYKVRDLTPAEDKDVKEWVTNWTPETDKEKLIKNLYLKGKANSGHMVDILLAKENTPYASKSNYFKPVDQKDIDQQFQYGRKKMGKSEKNLTQQYIKFNESPEILTKFLENKLTQEEMNRIYPNVKKLATLFETDLKANTNIFGVNPNKEHTTLFSRNAATIPLKEFRGRMGYYGPTDLAFDSENNEFITFEEMVNNHNDNDEVFITAGVTADHPLRYLAPPEQKKNFGVLKELKIGNKTYYIGDKVASNNPDAISTGALYGAKLRPGLPVEGGIFTIAGKRFDGVYDNATGKYSIMDDSGTVISEGYTPTQAINYLKNPTN